MALSDRALCTLDLVLTELGLTSDSGGPQDKKLERLIEAASRKVASFLRYPSLHHEAAREDDVHGYGTPILHVPKTPVLSIGSIVFDADDSAQTINASDYFIDKPNTGAIFHKGNWAWTAREGRFIQPFAMAGTERSWYRVTYECGWVTRNQDENNMTLPEDIEDVCIQLVSRRFKWEARDPAIRGEKLGPWSATYGGAAGASAADLIDGIPSELAETLLAYRRII